MLSAKAAADNNPRDLHNSLGDMKDESNIFFSIHSK